MIRSRRCAHEDRGATLVEAAFVLPLVLLFVFGLIEFGYAEYLDSQATSAARDGARVGILDPRTSNQDEIEAAVRARLGSQDPTVEITCLDGLEGEAEIDCDGAVPGDRIRVVTDETRDALTPAGALVGTFDFGAQATMVIVGPAISVPVPTPGSTTTTTVPGATSTTSTSTTSTSAPPGSCTVTSTTVASPITFGNGANADRYTNRNGGTTLTVRTSAGCTGLKVRFPNGNPVGYVEVNLTPTGNTNEFSAPIGFRAYSVPVGSHPVRILNSSGTVIDQSFTITRSS
jgi:Flp pilus assembly protein TadG